MKYFETIKIDDYEIFNLSYHEKRIANTIAMNLNLNDYIYAPNKKLLRCKVIYDEFGILDVNYFEYKKREIRVFKIVHSNEISYNRKFLDRNKIDEIFSKKDCADEVIIFKNDLLTDTSIANIALFIDGVWFTPKTTLLDGTTRQRYLDEKLLIEKDLKISDLKKAKKIALMNAMIDFCVLEDYSFLE